MKNSMQNTIHNASTGDYDEDLDIDQFFLPGGILDPDASESSTRNQINYQPRVRPQNDVIFATNSNATTHDASTTLADTASETMSFPSDSLLPERAPSSYGSSHLSTNTAPLLLEHQQQGIHRNALIAPTPAMFNPWNIDATSSPASHFLPDLLLHEADSHDTTTIHQDILIGNRDDSSDSLLSSFRNSRDTSMKGTTQSFTLPTNLDSLVPSTGPQQTTPSKLDSRNETVSPATDCSPRVLVPPPGFESAQIRPSGFQQPRQEWQLPSGTSAVLESRIERPVDRQKMDLQQPQSLDHTSQLESTTTKAPESFVALHNHGDTDYSSTPERTAKKKVDNSPKKGRHERQRASKQRSKGSSPIVSKPDTPTLANTSFVQEPSAAAPPLSVSKRRTHSPASSKASSVHTSTKTTRKRVPPKQPPDNDLLSVGSADDRNHAGFTHQSDLTNKPLPDRSEVKISPNESEGLAQRKTLDEISPARKQPEFISDSITEMNTSALLDAEGSAMTTSKGTLQQGKSSTVRRRNRKQLGERSSSNQATTLPLPMPAIPHDPVTGRNENESSNSSEEVTHDRQPLHWQLETKARDNPRRQLGWTPVIEETSRPSWQHRIASISVIGAYWKSVKPILLAAVRYTVKVLTLVWKYGYIALTAFGQMIEYGAQEAAIRQSLYECWDPSLRNVHLRTSDFATTLSLSTVTMSTLSCYLCFLGTPILCDTIMSHADFPHLTPHVLSHMAIYYLCYYTQSDWRRLELDGLFGTSSLRRGKSSGMNGALASPASHIYQHQHPQYSPQENRRRLANYLSYTFLHSLRTALPLNFVLEDFSSSNAGFMLMSTSIRLIEAYTLSLIKSSLVLSPVAWIVWSVQVLLVRYLPSGFLLDSILFFIGLATLRFVDSLRLESAN